MFLYLPVKFSQIFQGKSSFIIFGTPCSIYDAKIFNFDSLLLLRIILYENLRQVHNECEHLHYKKLLKKENEK